ncbi:MAG: GDP-mannose 4,6-dehydratase, partial [Atribacterota bacterium]|nr:GDP-mannose 4,6-dehydratase [Atribacterota bacterium]
GEAGVIAIFINEMLKGDTPKINGDGEYIRDYIYVEDVANACLLSIKNMLKLSRLAEQEKGIHFTSFNLGTGQATSVNQLFCYLKKIINFDREASYGPSRPGDLRKNILNNQLAKKHLAWHPKYTIQEGLKKTVDWFKSMKNI